MDSDHISEGKYMKERKQQRTKVFASYSHQDKAWLERLQIHLRPLARDFKITIWDDTHIHPGDKWRQEIEDALQSTFAAVLMVSADFLASDFVANDELPSLLKAAEEEGVAILPVIVSPCRFAETPSLFQFQAVNDPSEPLVNLTKGEQETVFLRVTQRIESVYTSRKMESGFEHMEKRLDDAVRNIAQLFLVTMSEPMYNNLCKLAQEGGFGKYRWTKGLERELYHLRDIGYIDVRSIKAIPRGGENLSDHTTVTKTGKQFIALRKSMTGFVKPQ